MGFFGKKKKEEEIKVVKKVMSPLNSILEKKSEMIIIKPLISEKSALLSDRNIYTFEIVRDANKYDVISEVKKLYNITPKSIRIVNYVPRRVHSKTKGRTILKSGFKKAYVYLKEGDRIELM